jgi:hypothetical protein
MMAPGIQPEKLAIQHERQQRQRAPIVIRMQAERPPRVLPTESARDLGPPREKLVVIVVDKPVMSYRPEDGDCKEGKQETNEKVNS